MWEWTTVRTRREAWLLSSSGFEMPQTLGVNGAPNGPPPSVATPPPAPEDPPVCLSLEDRILQLRPKSNLLARLADLMEPRERALTEELRKEVYDLGDDDESEKSEGSFKQLIYRTNDVLRELEYPRRLRYTAHLVCWKTT